MSVLFFVLFMGIALAMTALVWRTVNRHQQELQLLAVGDEFRDAIGRYYESSPGLKHYPQRLEDLLLDPRFPQIRRYLRKIYADPLTGRAEWSVVRAAGEGIIGVHSLSEDEPLKVANFDAPDRGFAGKHHYSEWAFTYMPGGDGGGDTEPAAGDAAATATPQGGSDATAAANNTSAANANPDTNPDAHGTCAARAALDASQCAQLRSWLGAQRGAQCDASAQARYATCMASQGTVLPKNSILLSQ